MLREPLERLNSHYKVSPDSPAMSFYDWATHQPDNYYTRILCGPACDSVPRGDLHTHLPRAFRNLIRFDVVVAAEDFKSDDRTAASVYKALRWSHDTPRFVHNLAKPDRSLSWQQQLSASGHPPDALQGVVHLDNLLYAYAKEKSRDHTKCKDPCCGPCSTF